MPRFTLTICAAVAAIAFATSGADVEAKEKQTVTDGVMKCYDWCMAHNKTTKSRAQCMSNCDAYWFKNGSDSVQK